MRRNSGETSMLRVLKLRKLVSLRSQIADGSHVLIILLLTASAFAWSIMMQRLFPHRCPSWWEHWTGSCETSSIRGATNNLAARPMAFRSNFLLPLGFTHLINRMKKPWASGSQWAFYNSFISFVFCWFSKCSNTTLFKVYFLAEVPPPSFLCLYFQYMG